MEGDFHIGQWLIQPSLNRMSKNGTTFQVEPRVMGVLMCLAAQPGHVVSRQHLSDHVWADTIVGDEAITRSISELRKVFADDPRHPRYIETIRKAGYRLIAPVTRVVPPLDPALSPTDDGAIAAPLNLKKRQGRLWWVAPFLFLATGGLIWLLASLAHDDAEQPPQVVPFTTYPGVEAHPALSPEGNQVAFVWDRGQGNASDIYVKLVGTETPLQLTTHADADISPAWSPDGVHIAFARLGDDCSIMIIPALGGAERKMASCGLASYPDVAWSPDGAYLAFSTRATTQEPHRIYLLSLETLEAHPLTTPPPQYYGDEFFAFSPDGTELAFVRTNIFGIMDVYLVPVEGGTAQRITFDNLKIRGLAWAPDGKHVIVASNRDVNYNLWRVPVPSGTPELIPVGDEYYGISVSGPTHRLVSERWNTDTNIWRTSNPHGRSAPRAQPEPFILSTRWDAFPQYAPDGRTVTFTSNRSGTPEVWVAEADGSNPRMLTAVGGAFVSRPRWSPSGTRLVYNSRALGNADVYLINTTGSPPQRFTDDPAIDLGATWSADGQTIYFGSNRSGTWQIWKKTVTGGEPVQVTHQGGYVAAESPDGQTLFFSKQDTWGLWQRPAAGGEESLLLETLDPLHWSLWEVVKEGIYFAHSAPGEAPRFAFYDFASQRTTLFPRELGMNMYSGMALSPDEHWVLYTRLDHRNSDLMLIEHFR